MTDVAPARPLRPCPTCKTPALPRPVNRYGPFCSSRCQLIDLGKWLSDDEDEDPEGEPEAPGAAPTAPRPWGRGRDPGGP